LFLFLAEFWDLPASHVSWLVPSGSSVTQTSGSMISSMVNPPLVSASSVFVEPQAFGESLPAILAFEIPVFLEFEDRRSKMRSSGAKNNTKMLRKHMI